MQLRFMHVIFFFFDQPKHLCVIAEYFQSHMYTNQCINVYVCEAALTLTSAGASGRVGNNSVIDCSRISIKYLNTKVLRNWALRNWIGCRLKVTEQATVHMCSSFSVIPLSV